MDRRQRIANAGIALIARGGTHRLTHRAVDAEAGLPSGSTSYYARSRRDLIRLVMEQLSAESQADLTDIEVPEKLTVRQATDLVGRLAKRLILNGDAQAARFALMFEVRDDDELRRELTVDAPVRSSFDEKAVKLLRALGATDPEGTAPEFVALVDAVLMYRAVEAAPIDPVGVVETYLTGLLVRQKPTATR
ncbi:TetR family transcriptional regulator [Arachnia propionica]|uniref:TetR/AcrR family transcriptional regulator n=1 Tax=Arachnia propionica TaxID=1750 RepID=UPI0030D117B9